MNNISKTNILLIVLFIIVPMAYHPNNVVEKYIFN